LLSPLKLWSQRVSACNFLILLRLRCLINLNCGCCGLCTNQPREDGYQNGYDHNPKTLQAFESLDVFGLYTL
jgi:hypothetical protein